MRYPNTRYGNPVAFAYYIQGVPVAAVAKRLRRSERSITDWLAGTRKMPWWIPELLRLQHMEHVEVMRQMGFPPPPAPLHLVHVPIAYSHVDDRSSEIKSASSF